MKALDRKLLRDLRLMWSQALTIALVVASGIGGFLATLSAVDSLGRARADFYASGAFADLFVGVKRAPLALLPVLRAQPGVADAQASVEMTVRIELDGVDDPILGRLIGLDPREPPRMNRVQLRSGRPLPGATTASEFAGGAARSGDALAAWVSEAFATAHGLRPGDHVGALLNGKRRQLVVAGIALSPEYIFAGLFGMPDQRGFGVFWVDRDALAAAFDMAGAFNQLAVKLAPGARLRESADALTRTLARYGGREALEREYQTSHAMLDSEIKSQRVLGTVLPSIFLGVAVFLLNVVISRLVATQREQIATLKALGYGDAAIGLHYLKFVVAIVFAGFLIGVALGDFLGAQLCKLYAQNFRFPRFEHVIAPQLLAIGFVLTLATAVAGTLNAIAQTVRLAPAEAMRPPAPGRYRRTWIERSGLARWLRIGPVGSMILRNMRRRPWRSTLAIVGVAAAVAIVIMGNFFRDAIEVIVESQFQRSMKSDVSVWMVEPVGDAGARHELARLPGVLAVEATRFVPATLVNGHRRERSLLRGYSAGAELFRIVDVQGHGWPVVGEGLILTDRLADKLGLRVGDRVRVEVLEGRARTLELPIDATVAEMMGLNAYMTREALNRALGDGELAGGFALAIERGREAELLRAVRGLPRVAGAFSKATMTRNMDEITARNVRIISSVLTLFAVVIAVGVVYNNARIALAERNWELASLRVLGFTRAEVSGVLLGEMALSIAIALPLGMLLGWGLVQLVVELLKNDQFFFPVVVRSRTYALAALAVVVAAVASALVVRRRIDLLDMASALKARD